MAVSDVRKTLKRKFQTSLDWYKSGRELVLGDIDETRWKCVIYENFQNI